MLIQFASLCCKRPPSSYSWFTCLGYCPLFTTAIHQAKGCICHNAEEQKCNEMLPLKGAAWQHKSNTKHVLCRCPLEKPVGSWGLRVQFALLSSLTCPPWLQHWYPGGAWVTEDRTCGTASVTASNCFFIYLVQASIWQKCSLLTRHIYFTMKQQWDIPARYLITYIFSCCKNSTGGDQGSYWSPTVIGGLELMSCSPYGCQKCHLNSRVGSTVCVPAQPRSEWWL